MDISKRLCALCSYVPHGVRLLDVGTDHAYLPISLILSGVVEYAWASDVNQGPLDSAAANAESFGVKDKITLYLSDGLTDCKCSENRYDVIVIAGMGGQTIADIISKNEFITNSSPTLILQPMTMQYELRSFLCDNGFDIYVDRIVKEDSKFYAVIVCRYTGQRYTLNEPQLSFGRFCDKFSPDDLDYKDYLLSQAILLKKISEGKRTGGLVAEREEELLRFINISLNEVDDENN